MIYLGADHRGYQLKGKIKVWLGEWGYGFEDVGNKEIDPEDDYTDFALRVSEGIVGVKDVRGSGENRGILICGSGIGMSIAANRVRGVRCGLCSSVEQTVAARREDDINCLALGADYISEDLARQIVEAFLKTSFQEEERYIRRISKL